MPKVIPWCGKEVESHTPTIGVLICTKRKGHDKGITASSHEAAAALPCELCGGFEWHEADDCPGVFKGGFIIQFDDKGVMWHVNQ